MFDMHRNKTKTKISETEYRPKIIIKHLLQNKAPLLRVKDMVV